jgi:hypothetical protein
MRGFLVACLLMASVADAQSPACKPSIPEDLRLICHKGNFAAVSPSAGEGIIFHGQRCAEA